MKFMAPPSSSAEKRTPPPFLHTTGLCMQSLTANILSHLPFVPPNHRPPNPSPTVTVPFVLPFPSPSFYLNANREEPSPSAAAAAAPSPAIESLSSSVRIEGMNSGSKGSGGGGPAFVGQVFSMLDPSGNGLMTVTSHFEVPFLSKRTPEWIKKMLAVVTKKEQNGPVFRFFMDLSDAVSYVKRLNIPTGMVGACRLDVAYQHFKVPTVVSESAFSIGGQIITDHKASLDVNTVQVLMCLRNWWMAEKRQQGLDAVVIIQSALEELEIDLAPI